MSLYFTGKKILIIGGTGTIGKSIVQTIMKENPQVIRLFSRDEYKQHQLQNELGSQTNKTHFIIGDVRDYDSVHAAAHDIDYVFHLAAMKHVDMCEKNPFEAVKTNIYGTKNMIKAAILQHVKKVVFTSSDKAISPCNAYGATKLIAEKLISAAGNGGMGKPVFANVRFGNVMGSRGSVIPLFKNGILKNKKITVTDRNITRFMMSLNQATELTIRALKEAKGGETFVLKMPVIRLGELAGVLIEEVCKQHKIKDEINVEIVGLRQGEKMFEELMSYDESKSAWELENMYIIPGSMGLEYEHAVKCHPGSYSSKDCRPLNTGQLHHFLKKAGQI